MFTYFKMKRKEAKLKLVLYTYIEKIITEKENIISLIDNLYLALKDVPVDELQREAINKLTELIHEEAKKNGEYEE